MTSGSAPWTWLSPCTGTAGGSGWSSVGLPTTWLLPPVPCSSLLPRLPAPAGFLLPQVSLPRFPFPWHLECTMLGPCAAPVPGDATVAVALVSGLHCYPSLWSVPSLTFVRPAPRLPGYSADIASGSPFPSPPPTPTLPSLTRASAWSPTPPVKFSP